MNLYSFLADTTAAMTNADGTPVNQANSWLVLLMQFGTLVLVIVLMYFILIRPQRKKQKEEQKMRNNMRVGDEITTIGGICGRIVNIKEDNLIIETGADRNKMSIKKWAVQTVDTIHDENDTVDDDDDDDDDDI